MRAAIVVLGDLGRSPRMLYHATAFAEAGAFVDLIGYRDSDLPVDVSASPRIRVWPVGGRAASEPHRVSRARFLVAAAWRAAAQWIRLLVLLSWRVPRPEIVLVQTPPGLPTLPVAWLVARLRSARLVIDWHNLTASMLALRLGPSHPLVRVADALEAWVGRRADGHLYVSGAMAQALGPRHSAPGVVFRDRPSPRFVPLSGEPRRAARRRLLSALRRSDPEDGALIVIGPTSWTADEDHDLLLEALRGLDPARFPPGRSLVIVMTGRGPRRADFEAALRRQRLPDGVSVQTAWFDAGTYPDAVAAADLGLCLHRSASGFDLPMKVADCFGAGVPVLALDYGVTLGEVVRDGENAWGFASATGLADGLVRMMRAVDDEPALLPRLRHQAAESGRVRWPEAWRTEAQPLLMPEGAPR